jgi:predicted nucleic acid-binding protein
MCRGKLSGGGLFFPAVKIYLDNSVLNRPYDDQRQPRVWLETLCFVLILQMVEKGEAELIHSIFHVLENMESPAAERRSWVEACLKLAAHSIPVSREMELRANALSKIGLTPLDAAHVAAAENAQADYFITCDDRLIRKYRGSLRALTPPELILILTKEQP